MTYRVGGMLARRKTSSWKNWSRWFSWGAIHKVKSVESSQLITRPVESYLKFPKADPVKTWLSVEFPDNESVFQLEFVYNHIGSGDLPARLSSARLLLAIMWWLFLPVGSIANLINLHILALYT